MCPDRGESGGKSWRTAGGAGANGAGKLSRRLRQRNGVGAHPAVATGRIEKRIVVCWRFLDTTAVALCYSHHCAETKNRSCQAFPSLAPEPVDDHHRYRLHIRFGSELRARPRDRLAASADTAAFWR